MRNRGTHSVAIKKKLSKSDRILCAYSSLQLKYAELLDENEDVIDIKANVLLEDFEVGDNYTTDFVFTRKNGSEAVRECVYKKNLMKPTTINLLDASRNYWESKGIDDWGIVIDV